MPLDTINILEYCNGAFLGLTSFSNDDKGQKEALALFSDLVNQYNQDNPIEAKAIKRFFKEGAYMDIEEGVDIKVLKSLKQ